MAERIYKGRFGWSAEDSSHSATHVLLTVAEYEQLCVDLGDARKDKKDTRRSADLEIGRMKTLTQRQIKDIQDDAAAQVADLQEQLEEARAEADYQKRLTENMLRINKERANVDRNLRPKKEHSGYAVISSQEREVRYDKGRKLLVVGETVLQSPYGVEFTEEQARKQIFAELLTNDGGWKLGDIGITRRNMVGIEQLVDNTAGKIKEGNTAFQQRLRANYKAGYWEYIVLHTLPLDVVPEDMLPG